ncbi:hypothetical protein TL16_g11959 [Triparma laevis f. inornata]|uniref:START domain-containing protein n=1 Tax=Triparma laevis f. inornata TaxID=1714386 RepID=A0A9W7BH96_9STRA|nr:hypothetical protein TL16_g11959 [Triparma laevis f. inornata]
MTKKDLIDLVIVERQKNTSLASKLSTEEAQRKKMAKVISEINEDETLMLKRKQLNASSVSVQPLARDAFDVTKGPKPGMLVRDINTKTISQIIHEVPALVLESLLSTTVDDSAGVSQTVLKDERPHNDAIIAHWAFKVNKKSNTTFIFLLSLEVEKNDPAKEIIVRVESIDEEELDSTCLQVPTPPTSRFCRVLLKDGTIIIRPKEFGQSSFTFKAQVGFVEEGERTISSTRQNRLTFSDILGTQKSKLGSDRQTSGLGTQKINVGAVTKQAKELFSSSSIKADEVFCNLAALFYDRFEKEESIDERRKKHFIDNIRNAPPLTDAEQGLIAKSMKIVEEVSTKAKRIAGTLSEPVEKFLYHQKEGAGWGMAVAKIDVSALILFVHIWLFDTYEHLNNNKGVAIREVWHNLDGTRSMQFSMSVSLPGSFQDRICEGSEKTTLGSSRGVHLIKELSHNACEWTRAQQGDLKIPGLPMAMMDFVAKQQLAWSNQLKEQYRRNGKEVDRERRNAMAEVMRARRGKPLIEDQKAVFASCEELLGGEAEEGWKALESTSPEVEMSFKYFPPKKGERSIGTGKAVCVVDCSAEEVAAWVMDICCNESMMISKEEGDPAKLELRERARANERTFATVKKMPFFLHNREFVFRIIWKSEEGKVLVAFESIDDEVDYGTKLKKIRGFLKGLWHIKDLPVRGGAKQCRLTYINKMAPGGSIPTWVADKKADVALSVVKDAIDLFRQDEKVDAAELSELASLVREVWADEEYTEEENAALQRICEKFEGSLKTRNWKQLKSPDPFVKMDSTFEDGQSISRRLLTPAPSTAVVGRAITVVDATLEDCAALELAKMTREGCKGHREFGGVDREVKKLNNHSELFYQSIDFGIAGFSTREWLAKGVWKMTDENNMVVVYEDAEHDDFPIGAGKNYQADLKGSIPKFLANSKIIDTLANLSKTRKRFDKSLDIDAGRRVKLSQVIKREVMSKEDSSEEYALDKFEALFEERKGFERPSRIIGLADTKLLGHGWGSTSVDVRAEMEEVVSFFWDFGSRANMEISGDVERTFEEDEEGTGLRKVVRRRQQLESTHVTTHRDRIFTSVMTLQKINNDTIVLLLTPIWWKEGEKMVRIRAHSAITNATEPMNAKETVVMRFRRMGLVTKLDYACEIETGSLVTKSTNRQFVERRLGEIAEVSIHFQRLLKLEDCMEHDGHAIGYDLVWDATSPWRRVERLQEVFKKNRALRELGQRHSWIKEMMAIAVLGNLHRNKPVETKLDCVVDSEARQIGKNLIPALMTEALAESGVDQWRVQNRAVRELCERHEWFKPMFVALGKDIVKTAHWGLMARVIVGAVLSVADMATDLFVLHQFWEGGKSMETFRNYSLASLAAHIFLQMIIVWMQNRKKGALRIMKETFIVVIGMKAPWDAYKVASGAEHEKDTQVDPLVEMSMSKSVEIFAESIPNIIIQTAAILKTLETGTKPTGMALTSLLMSALTTGFVSASISYDLDSEPKSRANNPTFFG